MTVALRHPETVMRLSRLGSAHQCRLSFMRTLLRRLHKEQWQFDRTIWQIDKTSKGHAVYQAIGPKRTYSLVACSHPLKPGEASDRVVATAWDASFTLFDGVPSKDDIARLKTNLPLQEAGRVEQSSLTVSRANRSQRLFSHVVESLASGQQPEQSILDQVGYLMRTTAVYGSGKLGAADRQVIESRSELAGSFQVEMLTVWLIRAFTVDLAEHEAKTKGGARSVSLDSKIKLSLGVGNATGLGMAPFLVNHPRLINTWITARETALANVRSIERISSADIKQFQTLFKRATLLVDAWHSSHSVQLTKKTALLKDIEKLSIQVLQLNTNDDLPWDVLYIWAENNLSEEGQEFVVSLLLELYPELVDHLANKMCCAEHDLSVIDGSMSVVKLTQLLENNYAWALAPDYADQNNIRRFWYISEEKQEPRLGLRDEEPGKELEQPLCVGWHVNQLYTTLTKWGVKGVVADFLARYKQHRHTVRRVQLIEHHPYMEIRDNLISNQLSPIDMLRLKLSFFGATNFDPRSDRWIRINMFQYAPYPDQLRTNYKDDWVIPCLPTA